eukprot:TRINITY_DN2206_c0_g1_i3.p1 TRINITY_DN2206_c0_g1~~TRINITY_DN2206_c0_g1_i3.p1  ORF type:complete len:167 (+),score=37.85 TRINITY_DN2206_c0_g1_i3:3-503(+)
MARNENDLTAVTATPPSVLQPPRAFVSDTAAPLVLNPVEKPPMRKRLVRRASQQELPDALSLRERQRQSGREKVAWSVHSGLSVHECNFHDLVRQGYTGDVDLVCRRAPKRVDDRDRFKATPLHKAAMFGHVNEADILLQTDADPDSQNAMGWTCLLYTSPSPRDS